MNSRGLIAIPAHNEEESILAVISEVRDRLPETDILVIDDGSIDETAAVLKDCGCDYVQHPHNLGYIEALRTGLQIASEENRPFLCFFDADGQHRTEDLQAMIARYHAEEPIDLLVASRFLDGNGEATSVLRGLGNRLFCWILGLLCRKRFTDVSNGLKLLSPEAIGLMKQLPLEDAHAELLLSAVQRGLSVEEFPARVLPREQGQSMITPLKALWYPIRTFLALLVVYEARKRK